LRPAVHVVVMDAIDADRIEESDGAIPAVVRGKPGREVLAGAQPPQARMPGGVRAEEQDLGVAGGRPREGFDVAGDAPAERVGHEEDARKARVPQAPERRGRRHDVPSAFRRSISRTRAYARIALQRRDLWMRSSSAWRAKASDSAWASPARSCATSSSFAAI